ncbi:MAG: hypothetical protein PHQ96_08955 [Candidatus Omnitrophica bacterium]|nr:hypothetical protein [Candidatus Omnitrophota bacterium]
MHYNGNLRKVSVGIFFLTLLILGSAIFKDYGMHWDERNNQAYGNRWFSYISKTITSRSLKPPESLNYKHDHDWTHGPFFEVSLVAIQKILGIKDSREIIFMRHFCVFLLFCAGIYFFYLLSNSHFKNWKIALLGCVFLVFSPRLFADAFYNSVDIAFFSFYILSIYTLILWLDKKTFLSAAIHALSCALLINIRPIGLTLPAYTAIFFIAGIIRAHTRKESLKFCKTFLLYFALLIILVFIFQPIFWTNTFLNLKTMVKFWRFNRLNSSSLYFSKFFKPKEQPWHYGPVWLAITTPVFYSFCFFIGSLASIKAFFGKSAIPALSKRNNFLFFVWLLLPLIGGHGRLYDGWRHLYFTYPAFLMFCLTGLSAMWEIPRIKLSRQTCKIMHLLIIVVTLASLARVAYFMVKYHPYQNVYFNRIAGKTMNEIKRKFDFDFWGLSYRKALEYILQNDKDDVVKVFFPAAKGMPGQGILPAAYRKRLIYAKSEDEAKYLISNYRWHPKEYCKYGREFFSIKIGGAKIVVVYKLK